MSLTINTIVGGTCGGCSVGGAILSSSSKGNPTRFSRFHHHPVLPQLLSLASSRNCHITSASDKFTSRTGKFDSKNRRNTSGAGTTISTTTTRRRRKEEDGKKKQIVGDDAEAAIEMESEAFVDDGFVMPDLPGLDKDFWEGPEWDALGFFVQYMWAFGIGFALIACGIAVSTYNEGATDFKATPAYKESVQSRDLFEGPETSDGSDVFESNPTEEAPSLE